MFFNNLWPVLLKLNKGIKCNKWILAFLIYFLQPLFLVIFSFLIFHIHSNIILGNRCAFFFCYLCTYVNYHSHSFLKVLFCIVFVTTAVSQNTLHYIGTINILSSPFLFEDTKLIAREMNATSERAMWLLLSHWMEYCNNRHRFCRRSSDLGWKCLFHDWFVWYFLFKTKTRDHLYHLYCSILIVSFEG